MLERDPKIILRNLVSTGYTVSNTPLASAPRFHTGWYNYGSSDPQVTFTNTEESTVNGGITGHTAGTGDGRASNVRAGTLLVNAWAGTREDMAAAGPDGSRVNPKDAAYQMAREVARILDDNNGGTQHPETGAPELNSIGVDPGRDEVDTEHGDAVFRYEITARYTYVENTK